MMKEVTIRMEMRRWVRPVLGSILLALCFYFVFRSAAPLLASQGGSYGNLRRGLLLEPVTLPSGGIDVNTADLAALDTLPGIGPVTAQAIIDEREQDGAYYYPEDLIAAHGVGSKTVEKIRELITLGEEQP